MMVTTEHMVLEVHVQNGYWYQSGGIHGMISHLRGPKYVRYIARYERKQR